MIGIQCGAVHISSHKCTFLKCSSTHLEMREGQMIQSVLQSPFILRAPNASRSPEETHRLLQPLHRVVVVFLLVRHLREIQTRVTFNNYGGLPSSSSQPVGGPVAAARIRPVSAFFYLVI